MFTRLTCVIAATLLVGLLAASTLLAGAIGSHLAVRCFDTDPTAPNAEGMLVFSPEDNRITLRLDFNNLLPPPPPLPPPPITDGIFDMNCESPIGSSFQVVRFFSGDMAMFGWDFETEFNHVFSPIAPGTPVLESCANPVINILGFVLDGPPISCVAGFLTPLPFVP